MILSGHFDNNHTSSLQKEVDNQQCEPGAYLGEGGGRAEFTYRLSRLKPKASEKMGGLGESKGPHHEQRRPPLFLVFTDIFSENTTSADVKTCFWFSLISSGKNRNSLGPLIV